jgi:hypothetical protein
LLHVVVPVVEREKEKKGKVDGRKKIKNQKEKNEEEGERDAAAASPPLRLPRRALDVAAPILPRSSSAQGIFVDDTTHPVPASCSDLLAAAESARRRRRFSIESGCRSRRRRFVDLDLFFDPLSSSSSSPSPATAAADLRLRPPPLLRQKVLLLRLPRPCSRGGGSAEPVAER